MAGVLSGSLRDHRLVFVAPDEGQTAVGDYAQDLVEALRPHFGEIAEVRTAGPGAEVAGRIPDGCAHEGDRGGSHA